ncbi:MAG: hypothetical protein AAB935_00440 [Patescibacteria group bacterium]
MQVKNFNERLEAGLVKIGEEVRKQIEQPEAKILPEREVLKQSIQSVAAQIPRASAATEAAKNESDKRTVLPDYLHSGDANKAAVAEVERLVGIAFSESLLSALAEAKKRPPFVEDAFHDALTDKLLPELQKRGILKQSGDEHS